MWFRKDKSGPSATGYRGTKYAKGLCRIVQLNYYGNQHFLPIRGRPAARWMQNETLAGEYAITNHCALESMRGRLCVRISAMRFRQYDDRSWLCLLTPARDISPDPDYLIDDMGTFPIPVF